MATKIRGAPRRGRKTRDESEGLQQSIADAALSVFLEQGFDSASMDAIAALAGVSKRTLYARFESKAELLRASLALHTATPLEALASLRNDPRAPEVVLAEVAYEIVAAMMQPGIMAIYRLISFEARKFPELAAQAQRVGVAAGRKSLAAYLRRQMDQGVLPPGDAKFLARAFFTLISAEFSNRWVLGVTWPPAPADVVAYVEKTVALFLRGCGR